VWGLALNILWYTPGVFEREHKVSVPGLGFPALVWGCACLHGVCALCDSLPGCFPLCMQTFLIVGWECCFDTKLPNLYLFLFEPFNSISILPETPIIFLSCVFHHLFYLLEERRDKTLREYERRESGQSNYFQGTVVRATRFKLLYILQALGRLFFNEIFSVQDIFPHGKRLVLQLLPVSCPSYSFFSFLPSNILNFFRIFPKWPVS
jgi:hypothetical protein